ncbi:MAG: peptidylprolyl isomerase [Sphingobacteriales bacterium]|jgi:peptidyl-prolyl cis-trans isomerase SurA|nr:peptidylprolyl isomerase [Sphingobacteriales bacterium]MBP9141078.1 peptidylprolyl isomerase [Chitinophagales bacterium]MDA0198300.1 peptidylprolyl isomerase [Bacteroidota bacterium]MBK7526008.1 peptidylprolyl isomerase [Sphingobacteriales bacterium]MBK8677718.1 peptidylprolyl isomerase [Sphingobacteriales bacterium]
MKCHLKFYAIVLLFNVFLFGANTTNTFAQKTANNNSNNGPVLFNYGSESVTLSEFKHVYEKQNANDANLYSKKSIDDYLDLYINFKIKVREAEAMGLDTLPSVKADLDKYRAQLESSYMRDDKINEQLIREAYDRLHKRLRVSHILIKCDENAGPNDTLNAWTIISDLKTKIDQGADFAELAKQHCQDHESVRNAGGDLGIYITAFSTVYAFETAAYNTPVGKVSQPVRTKYGYHLIKVTDVKKLDVESVEAATIFIKSTAKDDAAKQEAAKKKIKALYKKLKKQPLSVFEETAKTNSEDKETAAKGGKFDQPITVGSTLPDFENALFALTKIDQVSKPIKTDLGWYIIHLTKRNTLSSYQEMHDKIKSRIERSNRSKIPQQVFIQQMREVYKLKEMSDARKEMERKISANINSGKFLAIELSGLNAVICELTLPNADGKGNAQKQSYTQQDFAHYIEKNQARGRGASKEQTFSNLYKMYIETILTDAEKHQMVYTKPEYARLLKEFRDGTILFEAIDQVWKKAQKDEAGLEAFYQANQKNYQWPQRASIIQFTANTKQQAQQLQTAVKANPNQKPNETIAKIAPPSNDTKIQHPTAHETINEKGQIPLLDKMEWKENAISEIIEEGTSFKFIQIKTIIPPGPKQLNEARGFVISDFQRTLEEEWVKNLKTKYPVSINQSTLEQMYKFGKPKTN